MSAIIKELEKEEKPIKALGRRFIAKFSNFLSNKISEKIINNPKELKFDRKKLDAEFSDLVKNNIRLIGELSIYTDDLIDFAEVMLGNHTTKINFEHLKNARSEFIYLLGFILRNSTLNRFLKELDDNPLDPETLVKKFHDFIWKRIGGLKSYWKEYILDIIKNFGEIYQQKFEDDMGWTKYRLINEFISYLKDTILESTNPEKFIDVLDVYITKIEDPVEKKLMLLFFEQYEYSLGILDDFPNYIKQKILKILNQMDFKILPIMAVDYLKSSNLKKGDKLSDPQIDKKNEIMSFFDFFDEFELRYLSKLIAFPFRIILKGLDKKEFNNKSLFYTLNFKFWKKFFKVNISSNWFQIRPKF